MLTSASIRRSAIERVAQRYIADGYTVRHEAHDIDGVDLLVERDSEERVVALFAPGRHITATLRDRLERWRTQRPNRFVDVHVLSDADLALPIAEVSVLRSKLHAAESAIDLLPEGSFLITWAVFEAVARALLEAESIEPPSTTAVVRALVTHGIVDHEQAQVLSPAINLRNALVHGSFLPVGRSELRALIDVTTQLLDDLSAPPDRARAIA